MKKVLFGICLLLLGLFSSLNAQSSEKVTQMLSSDEITVAQASYFSATYLELISEDSSDVEAVYALENSGVWKTSSSPTDTISLAEFSGLCMKTWKIKGGLFYTLLGSDRYALKELKAKECIEPAEDPSSKVSGRNALNIIMLCMEISDKETL